MSKPARHADSLDQVELLMALEEEIPHFDVLTDALERWNQTITHEQALRLIPYLVEPVKVSCVRNGFATEASLVARRSNVGLAVDRSCGQFAVGDVVGDSELRNARHYPTLELALRSLEGSDTEGHGI